MLNEVANIIGSYGFPIVACCYLAYYQKTTLDSLRDVISSNTNATERLIDAVNRGSVERQKLHFELLEEDDGT